MPTSILHSRLRRWARLVAATTRSAARSAFSQDIWIVGVFSALLSLLYTGIILQDSRRTAVEHARTEMRGLGIVLAEQTSRYVQTLDLLLQQTQLHIAGLAIRTPDQLKRLLSGEDIHRFLTVQMTNLPPNHGIALFDAAGALLNASLPSPAQFNIADHDFFQQLRDHGDSEVVVSDVAKRHMTGAMAFFVGRRISGTDGTFLGVIVTTIDVDEPCNFYKAIDSEQRLAVTLRRRDGFVLVHYPPSEGTSHPRPATASWFSLVAAGGGTYRAPGDSAGAAAIVSVNPAHDYPLVLDVAVAEENMLKPWHDQAVLIAAGGGGFSLSLLLIFGLLGRQIRRQKEQSAAISGSIAMLRESESKFRAFSELASDWFWEQGADLRFTSDGAGSRSKGNIRSKDRASPIGKLRWELNDTSLDPEGWEDHRRTVLAHQPFRDFCFEQTDENGQTRHVSISGVPVHDQTGVFTGYRGIGQDITPQIEAEHALRQAKERAESAEALMQDAIDSIAEGFVIGDADGRQVVCNESYRRMHEYQTGCPWAPGNTREHILRQGLVRGIYPDAVGREQEWLAELLQQNHEDAMSMERPLTDGRWLLLTRQRMRNGGVAVLLIDITALKQAQAALSDSEASLERAQEIGRIGSWELDIASGEFTWSRHLYRMRGYPPDHKMTIENLGSRLHAADLQRLLDWFAELTAGRQCDPIEIRTIRPDGVESTNINEGRPVVDADGVIRHIAGTSQDVTERRLIERTLAQSQKMDALGQLTGGMAHDFNNMLGIIIGNLDLLKPLLGAEALSSELCAEARDGAVRCAELIRRLLAFARRQPLHPDRTNVNALVGDLSRLLGRTLGEHVALTLELDATLWPVKVDASQLEAALINLATNARDAMPEGGQLILATRNTTLDTLYIAQHPDVTAGDYAQIEVSDTGTGIAPEIIDRIFDPFFTTKVSGQGTGLGLSMAFGFAKQSGGHLTVYSEPGLGTTFRLYLPRSDSTEATRADTPSADVVVGGDETILVVEDNAKLRRVVERQLTELGYKVREADCALPALDILSSTDPVDLLFTDIVMPGTMDGLELAYQAARQRPDLRVLLTSGFPSGQRSGQRMAGCPFRLLGKPYSLRDLAQAVRRVLDGADNGTKCKGRSPMARLAEETEPS
jgi:signal transduction histidine kinase/ActR/RegA family two-component response regulator